MIAYLIIETKGDFSGKLGIDNQSYPSKTMTENIQRGSRGPAPHWNLGRTKTIRVPIAIADRLIEIARKIDRGEPVEPTMFGTGEDAQELSKSSHLPDSCR
ncbi:MULTISPECIES: hypothetical protein [unclassified Coleofasciculus]|uniref:hypothetical protein n=1 Tax=unclassified Coleofasciculus TaxID=2692782 RepID=UPI001881B255|nr:MULTISPECIES: hypothetical protein [unclassified Coleofasciculus]MBE9129455.1 hypothetical protein [Coleofasciculus sp. LEGE 07081]MBE9152229.1 hypothetical protein [Coleofasciculus sp. LEGE 07092]